MQEPELPLRLPDLTTGSMFFWFKEKLVGDHHGTVRHLNPDNWNFYSPCRGKWISIYLARDELSKIKDFYATWLLEKEILEPLETDSNP